MHSPQLVRSVSLVGTGIFLVACALPAAAQSDLRSQLTPITAPIRYAGAYHLGTGAWTKAGSGGLGAPASSSGTAILFDNTCVSGYTVALNPGGRCYDEGRLPSPTSPVQANTWGLGNDSEMGSQSSYTIDGFQIGYCTSNTAPTAYTLRFYEAYTSCAVAPAIPTASFALTGLPGATLSGSSSCWIVDIDLCASSQSFTMLADADQVYDGAHDHFGWSWEMVAPAPLNGDGWLTAGGRLSAGSYQTCSGSDGTVFDTGTSSAVYPANSDAITLGCGTLAQGASPEPGSGMGTMDQFRLENWTGPDGCYWFGGVTQASLYLKLYSADVALPGSAPGVSYCEPALGGVPSCPCGNPPSGVQRGCDNSAASGGATLVASGSASIASDTLHFTAAGEPSGVLTILLQGTNGVPALRRSQGVSCIGGTLERLYVLTATGGGISVPGVLDPSVSARSAALGDVLTAGSQRTYCAVYHDPIVLGGCLPTQTLNCSNANAVHWN